MKVSPRRMLFTSLILIGWTVQIQGELWINEFHYDNDGGDVGEFVEIAIAPDMSGVDLSQVLVTTYNGSNGNTYGSATSLTDSASNSATNGFSFYSLSLPGLQNGPDGIYLEYPGGSQFLSYEGSFMAADGPAAGMTSTDIGVSEPANTPEGSSLALTGIGSSYSDFTWTLLADDTPGAINVGQTAVPEPTALLYLIGPAIGAVIFARSRKRAKNRARNGTGR